MAHRLTGELTANTIPFYSQNCTYSTKSYRRMEGKLCKLASLLTISYLLYWLPSQSSAMFCIRRAKAQNKVKVDGIMQLSRCNIFFPFVDLVPHLHVYVVFFAKLRTFIIRNFPNNAQTQKDNCGVIVLIDKPPCGSIFQVRLFHNIAELNITVDWMNSKATCMYQHICVFICLVCVCTGASWRPPLSERHSCPVPSVSVVAGSS